jgi:hypothetical protein
MLRPAERRIVLIMAVCIVKIRVAFLYIVILREINQYSLHACVLNNTLFFIATRNLETRQSKSSQKYKRSGIW